MSDGAREWRFYVDDMIAIGEHVLTYTAGMDQSVRRQCTGVRRYLAHAGTHRVAAIQVPDDVRQAHRQVPWRMVIATRNGLIHACLGVDNDNLWSIVSADVPALLPMLRAARGQPSG